MLRARTKKATYYSSSARSPGRTRNEDRRRAEGALIDRKQADKTPQGAHTCTHPFVLRQQVCRTLPVTLVHQLKLSKRLLPC